ncbi:hemolysin family protein [Endomicrobium proavitum]|uniref:Magnesium/cobalt efflux protein n=1 Tax=Endomicrobium proavitum TaxID=1408281 RepID=A0A0G3WJE0_9BACT|nr:hemolysin family protein [Endomicrobium proavitum]AKL97980.1 magnesium/cobalt efflux protein [Endomicrobium proavitum]
MFIFLGGISLLFLIVVSSWISAAEIGITSLSKYRVKKLIAQKPNLSKLLLSWLKSPYYLLTIILTVNVVSDMLISYLSASVLRDSFYMVNKYVVEAVTWILTSFVLLVFAEIVPKFYARANSEKITLFSIPILSKIWQISKPFLYPIIKLTEIISPKTTDISSYELSEEEIKYILSEGDNTGVIDKETSGMLERTLTFGALSVKRIVTPINEIESVDLALDEEDFIDRAVETSRSRIPVYNESKENIIGYIHIKDILEALKNHKGRSVKSLIKPPYFVDENKKISDLLKEFKTGKTHMAFVKSKTENITGIVTLEDVLEEVVGGIIDEYEFAR